MIVSIDGVVQPDVGSEDHWTMFDQLRQHADLFNPMRDLIVARVADIVAVSPTRPYIDARQLGAQVLGSVSSWWYGEFPRRFPNFPNGSERGIHGMTLWNYLATKHNEWWSFTAQEDAHGYGQAAMQYWRLPPGDPLIPADNEIT